MASATVFDSTPTNPGGTGSTITVTLPTHAVGDIIYISVGNTGNVLWTGNPTGWNRIQQVQVGTAANGLLGTWFWRKVVSGDSLPLANPLFTLGATVTREAFARTVRGADLESPFVLPEWVARGYNSGTANPVRPASITTPFPEGLILHDYFSRSATNAPDPSGYTQDEEIVISGTLVGNASQKTNANQQTLINNQDASPTSGVRWVAGILCVPSPDYVYYRSGTQALTASGTSATPALPTGTSASDNRGNKDLIIATAECAGATPSPNTPADWNEITDFATTTSGGATTIRKWWTPYDGTVDRQFTRPTTGEILVYLSTYRNAHQIAPIGNIAKQQNASSTTSPFPALIRARTKSSVQITCIADGTPTFTSPSGFTERNDSNGVTCADQSFNDGGTVASASFTLSTANPTAAGLIELASVSSVPTGLVLLEDNFNDNSRDAAKWALGSIAFENAGVGVAEANQQIEISPLALTGTPAIYGYKSLLNTYDFTGREAVVRIAADIDPNTEAWLVVALDADNYLRTWVASGNLQTRSRAAAVNSNQNHGTFSFATHTYWRIRHDAGPDEIVWEYSANGIAWTELRRLARPITITSMGIYLSGGTGSSIASPGLVKFDDFFLRDPPHLLAIQDSNHALTSSGVTLTQVHSLVVAAADHSHAVENVVLDVAAASLIAQYGGTRRGVFGRVFSGVD